MGSLKKSLAFEELLAQQLYITKLKAALAKKRSVAIEAGQLRDRFIKLLDFSLTESQSTVLEEIDLDKAIELIIAKAAKPSRSKKKQTKKK